VPATLGETRENSEDSILQLIRSEISDLRAEVRRIAAAPKEDIRRTALGRGLRALIGETDPPISNFLLRQQVEDTLSEGGPIEAIEGLLAELNHRLRELDKNWNGIFDSEKKQAGEEGRQLITLVNRCNEFLRERHNTG
jgi:hypothetical protein